MTVVHINRKLADVSGQKYENSISMKISVYESQPAYQCSCWSKIWDSISLF